MDKTFITADEKYLRTVTLYAVPNDDTGITFLSEVKPTEDVDPVYVDCDTLKKLFYGGKLVISFETDILGDGSAVVEESLLPTLCVDASGLMETEAEVLIVMANAFVYNEVESAPIITGLQFYSYFDTTAIGS